MFRQMTATALKAQLLGLLDEVAEGEEIEITKHGRTIARLVPATGPQALMGRLADVAASIADEDDLFTTGLSWNLP